MVRHIEERFANLFPDAWDAEAIAESELVLLRRHAGDDHRRFARWLKRRLCGDPIAYIINDLEFMGRHFRMDRRAHVTDPETVHLVRAVLAGLDGAPTASTVAEVGIGAGTLGLTLMLERPGTHLVGLDLDRAALALCRENATLHGLEPELLESDMLIGWGDRPEPDLLFGDLPWGDETTLYDEVRDCRHYLKMPPAAAFPLGDRVAAHRDLLRQVVERDWRCPVLLNCGTLPESDIREITVGFHHNEVMVPQPSPGLRLLRVQRSGQM